AQALMGNQLSWHAIETALARAVSMEIISEEDLDVFSKDMLIKAAAEVKESRHFSELKDLHIVLEDAAREYLELQVKLSPLEVLTALSSLEILKVSEEVVQQLKAEMRSELERNLQDVSYQGSLKIESEDSSDQLVVAFSEENPGLLDAHPKEAALSDEARQTAQVNLVALLSWQQGERPGHQMAVVRSGSGSGGGDLGGSWNLEGTKIELCYAAS
ncbi:epsE, partial [Symbiodinium necroappetens]